jgi:hypothetical protein
VLNAKHFGDGGLHELILLVLGYNVPQTGAKQV